MGLPKVPAGFWWGVAIASHQNEGAAPASDWAKAEAEGRFPHSAGEGTRFREHVDADLDLVSQALGGNALRTSIEWARLEPQPGVWDLDEVAYLHTLFAKARTRGLAVIVTLHHFTSPQWIYDGAAPSGWESPRTAAAFARYAAFVAREFRGQIDAYLTFNETSNLVAGGYFSGFIPPFRRGLASLWRAMRVTQQAHVLAYQAIHGEDPSARVSITEFTGVFPLGPFPLLYTPGYLLDLFWPRGPKPLDFVSLHYYGDVSLWDMRVYPPKPYRFDTRPAYFERAIESAWRRYKLPILIGENGLATNLGEPRRDGWDASRYMQAHVSALQATMARGVPILGYLWWTLTDNYEWGTYDTRFGLYRVECLAGDYTRVPTPAVETYRRVIANGGVETVS